MLAAIVQSIALAHPDPDARASVAQLLRDQGIQVYSAPSIAGVLSSATQTDLCAAVIDPRLLAAETADLRGRIRGAMSIFSVIAPEVARPEMIGRLSTHGTTLLFVPSSDVLLAAKIIFKALWSLSTTRDEAKPAEALAFAELVADGEGPTILVVDDEPAFRGFVCDALAAESYRVWSSSDGLKALAFLQYHTVDLVISDVNMQGLDGYALKMQLDLSKDRPPPFIVMTADTGVNNVMSADAAGVAAIVSKPIESIEALYASVRKALGSR